MSKRTYQHLALCAGVLFAAPNHASAEMQRQRGAHVHGVTSMRIAQDGRLLSVTVEMPGMNAIGYEHPPHTAAQRAQLVTALDILRKPADWLVPNTEARCRLASVEVTPNGFGASAPGNSQTTTQERKEAEAHEHADVDASYQFQCDAPLDLRLIELRLIERFPGTHEVRVDIVSLSDQAQEVFSTPRAEITFTPAAP
jgi:hypothetical protein